MFSLESIRLVHRASSKALLSEVTWHAGLLVVFRGVSCVLGDSPEGVVHPRHLSACGWGKADVQNFPADAAQGLEGETWISQLLLPQSILLTTARAANSTRTKTE